jgi:hypothetical protein
MQRQCQKGKFLPKVQPDNEPQNTEEDVSNSTEALKDEKVGIVTKNNVFWGIRRKRG